MADINFDELGISKKPENCRNCGGKQFISKETCWSCASCGKNYGKAIMKTWVSTKKDGKMVLVREGRIRPDLKTQSITTYRDSEGNKIKPTHKVIDNKTRKEIHKEHGMID